MSDVDTVLLIAAIFGVYAGATFAILSHRFRHPTYHAGCTDCLLERIEP